MSILNVNTIQPFGSAQTVTVSATDLKIGTTTLQSGSITLGNSVLSSTSTVFQLPQHQQETLEYQLLLGL